MSQPSYAVEYLGAEYMVGGSTITSTSIKTKYPTANMMKIKTEDVKVSINGTTMFPTTYDNESYIPTTSTNYIFNIDCILAVGRYIAIAP